MIFDLHCRLYHSLTHYRLFIESSLQTTYPVRFWQFNKEQDTAFALAGVRGAYRPGITRKEDGEGGGGITHKGVKSVLERVNKKSY